MVEIIVRAKGSFIKGMRALDLGGPACLAGLVFIRH
jgi:hypothetical protein